MKMRFFCAVLLVFCCLAHAQTPECNLAPGKELDESQRKQFRKTLASKPDVAAVMFDLALSYARLGNYRKAWASLELALKHLPWLDPASEPDFKPFSGCAEFKRLVERVESKYPPVATARSAFIIGPKDLIPEGLAADPVDGTLYLSSIFHRKIVKIARDGTVSDFVSEGQDGLLGVLGIKVDARDRSVWAASERAGAAALYHFDSHGKLLGKYAPREKGKHLFNDLVVTSHGDVFVTDSEDQSVYKLPGGADRLSRFSLGDRFYPNGIALSSDEKALFVAHAFGIVRMDLQGSAIVALHAPPGISHAQIDGLYSWKGSLIAIQNGYGPNRIVRLQLSADGKAITSGQLLEFRSANLELPTTGAILNDRFYYIVNSQIDHELDGELRNEGELKPVKIAVIDLQ